MKISDIQTLSCLLVCVFTPFLSPATTFYVDVNSSGAAAPYADWSTAATNIQDAVDAASDGDLILVNDGIYQEGGRTVGSGLTNRVVIGKAVIVKSVNGPGAATIQGNPVLGSNAVRCAYLGTNAVLSGFTITGGATDDTNESDGGGIWAVTAGALVTNCIITGNAAAGVGGGVVGGTLVQCIVSNNYAASGGGVSTAVLSACVVTANTASSSGGGMIDCTASNCLVIGNDAYEGGGAYDGQLDNCVVTNNSAYLGGGAGWATVNNSLLMLNAASYGGGAQSGTLNNCTVVVNSGGGAAGSAMNNCILLYNTGGNYYDHLGAASLNYCCTVPLPGSGTGNQTNDPRFVYPQAGNFHLRLSSPCIDAGNDSLAVGDTDLDGSPRIAGAAVDLGAYEFHGGTHYADINSTNPVPPYLSWNTAATNIQDAIDASSDGDAVVVNDGIYNTGGEVVGGAVADVTTGGRTVYPALTNRVAVTKLIDVRSLNGAASTIIAGYQPPGTNDSTAIRCIYLTNGASLTGFTLTGGATFPFVSYTYDWYYNQSGGGIWCLSTNPIVTDCVIVGNSAGDAGAGVIGGTLIRCLLANNVAYDAGGGAYDSTLISCTVTNNLAPFGGGGSFIALWLASGAFIRNTDFIGNLSQDSGGGAYGGVLTDCSLIGNACVAGSGSPTYGGGACCAVLERCVLGGNSADYGGAVGDSSGYSVLYNCIVTNNASTFDGGGLYGGSGSAAYNCAVLNNTAGGNGGGAAYYELDNCIVYFNNGAPDSNAGNCNLNFSCTTPSPGGNGNFTNAPAFVDLAAGDLHLQSNSPCINSGSNFYLTNNSDSVVIATDFDGNPRVANTLVDVGPFESQLPGSILPYAWLLQYGLPIDGSADYVDSDGDGLNNWQEWIAGTDPTNSASVLAMVSAMPATDYSSVTVSWQSVSGRSYYLQRSSALSGSPGFTTIQTHIGGQAGTTSYIDYTATGDGPYFYRVGIQQ